MLFYVWEDAGVWLPEIIPLMASQPSGARVQCFHILSFLGAHQLTIHGGCNC